MSDAKTRVRDLLPSLKLAIDAALLQEPEGRAMLGVLSRKPDGSGVLTASFECEEFVQDLLELLGYASMDELLDDEEEVE